jgi:hypothetical protein
MRELMVKPEIYALIDMNIVRKFRRAASLGIWEFCVRFEKVKRTSEVKWEVFRDIILGESADNKTYQEYKFFKSKVLNPSIAEINSETLHTIELLESKMGKRVSALSFIVTRKASAPPIADDEVSAELAGNLVKLGVPLSEAKKICKTQSADEIGSAVGFTRRRMADKKNTRLENPAAYFRHALANRYAAADRPRTSSDAPAPATGKPINIKASYAAHQCAEAERYFNELDQDDQALMIDRYNGQQPVASLQLKKRATKLALAGFFQWLARTTWGDPSTEELLEFAQSYLLDPRPQ